MGSAGGESDAVSYSESRLGGGQRDVATRGVELIDQQESPFRRFPCRTPRSSGHLRRASGDARVAAGIRGDG